MFKKLPPALFYVVCGALAVFVAIVNAYNLYNISGAILLAVAGNAGMSIGIFTRQWERETQDSKNKKSRPVLSIVCGVLWILSTILCAFDYPEAVAGLILRATAGNVYLCIGLAELVWERCGSKIR